MVPVRESRPGYEADLLWPAGGPGAVYEWDGDSNIGAGRMEILESFPKGVGIDFRMSRPMDSHHNEIAFTLEPAGDSTNVTG